MITNRSFKTFLLCISPAQHQMSDKIAKERTEEGKTATGHF